MKYNITLSLEQIDVLRNIYNGISDNEIDIADLYAFGDVLIEIQDQALRCADLDCRLEEAKKKGKPEEPKGPPPRDMWQ